jgi:hypothetical protein
MFQEQTAYTKGNVFGFLFSRSTLFNTASTAAPQGSTVSEDAGIGPRTVATLALSVRRSKHSARKCRSAF